MSETYTGPDRRRTMYVSARALVLVAAFSAAGLLLMVSISTLLRIEARISALPSDIIDPPPVPDIPPPCSNTSLSGTVATRIYDQLPIGITIWRLPKNKVLPQGEDLRLLYYNEVAGRALPELIKADLGDDPYSVFPSMDHPDHHSYFDLVSSSALTQTPVPFGTTTFDGIEWFSLSFPASERSSGIAFFPLGSLEDRNPGGKVEFPSSAEIKARADYLDFLIQGIEESLKDADTRVP